MFNIARYSVCWIYDLHFTQTCSFQHQLDFSGKHSSHAAITREDYSLWLARLASIKYALYQPLYPEFIVYCCNIKRAAATFAQSAGPLHDKT